MADGFRGMINDFMEIFNCLARLPCFTVPSRCDDYSSIHSVPLPKAGVSELFETDTDDREAGVKEDAPGRSFVDTASSDGCTDSTFPRGGHIEDDKGLDLRFSSFRERLCSTSEGEEDSLSIKPIKNDSEFTTSLQVADEKKSARQRKLKSRWKSGFIVGSYTEVAEDTGEGMHIDSSSDAANYYSYSKKVGEEADVQKHLSNQWIMVEDHIPSLEKKKSTRDSSSADDSDYVILKKA